MDIYIYKYISYVSDIRCIGGLQQLTHWDRVTHVCVGNLSIIGSDNGLSPGRCQAIICTNAGILYSGPLGTKFCDILIKIHTFSFNKIYLKMSAEWWPFCLDLNGLKGHRIGWSGCLNPFSMLNIPWPFVIWLSTYIYTHWENIADTDKWGVWTMPRSKW